MKTTLSVVFAVAIMLNNTADAADRSATGSEWFFRPYVGADYEYSALNYRHGEEAKFADYLNGGDVHIGVRVHKHLGFEASYIDAARSRTVNGLGNGINDDVSVSGFALDAMAYLPVDQAARYELIGTVGVSQLTGSTYVSGLVVLSQFQSETRGRVGVGAQYWLTDNLNVRGLLRYQKSSFGDSINDIIIAGVGVNWQF